MKISDTIDQLLQYKQVYGDLDIAMLIHEQNDPTNIFFGTNYLSKKIHSIYYDELTNSIEIFGFLTKKDL